MAISPNPNVARLSDYLSGGTSRPRVGPRPAGPSGLTITDAMRTFGSSSITGQNAKEKTELERARQNAARRILSDPIARQNNPQMLIDELTKIAQGKKDDGGGLFGFLGDVGGGLFNSAMYALGRPLAIVASAGKEISDIASGQASFEDFFKQAAAKDTTVSKYLPKTGVKWLDGVIGFTADVALDPLTWVIPGAKAFTGRSGRLSLAAKAAESGNLAKAPTLAAKVADGSIAKYGEWALDDLERQVLGVDKGWSWLIGGKTIGKPGTALGRLSAGSSEFVGKNFAKARAAVGSNRLLKPVQQVTTLGSAKRAKLGQYGRYGFDATPEQVFSRLAVYSSSTRGSSGGKLFGAKLAKPHFDLITEAAAHERNGGAALIDLLEGTLDPTIPMTSADRAMADKLRNHLDLIRTTANDISNDVSGRRGNRIIDIAHRDNYVPHAITPQAKEYTWRLKTTDGNYRNVVDLLDIPSEDFLKSPSPLRARKVMVGDDFLGRTVEALPGQQIGDSATIRQMNKISNDVLGFDWFETDVASYMNSYLRSVQNQVARIRFVDRLYDYGTDVVDNLTQKLVPDRKVVRHWRTSEKFFNNMIDTVNREIWNGVTDVRDIAIQQRKIAEMVMLGKSNEIVFTQNQIGRIRQGIAKAREQLAIAEQAARERGAEIEQAFNILVEPHRARINAIDDALAGNRADEMIALMQLEDQYRKMFPNAKKMPEDPMELAARIIAKTESTTGATIRMLQTQKRRLESTLRPTRGKVGRAEAKARANVKAVKAEIAQLDKQIADLSEAFGRSSEVFPEGYFFVRKSDVMNPNEMVRNAYGSAGRNAGAVVEGADITDTAAYMRIREAEDWANITESSPQRMGQGGAEDFEFDPSMEMSDWADEAGPTSSMSRDELAERGFVTAPNSDYIVTSGGVTVYPSIPEGEPMSRFMMVYAPAENLEPGLGARILKPTDDVDDYLDFVDLIAFGIGKTLNDLGDNRTAEAFAEQWDNILRSREGGSRSLDPSFEAVEPELSEILSTLDDVTRSLDTRMDYQAMTPEERAVWLQQEVLDDVTILLDGFMARMKDEPGATDAVLGMDGGEFLRYSIGQVGDPRAGFDDVVGIDLRDVQYNVDFDDELDDIFDGGNIVINSGYLARTIEPVPTNSTIMKQAFRGGVDVTGDLMSATSSMSGARSLEATVAEELAQATEAANAKRAQLGTTNRRLGAQERLYRERMEKVGGLQGDVERARNQVEITGPGGEVENLGTMMQAEEAIAASQAVIDAETAKLQRALQNDPVMKTAARKADAVKVAESRLDAPQALLGEQEEWMRTTGAVYQAEIDEVRRLVQTMPNSTTAKEVTGAWLESMDRTLRSLESAPLEPPTKNALTRVMKQVKGLEADLAMYESMRDLSIENLEKALMGDPAFGGKMVDDLKEGWQAIREMGVQVSPEVDRLLNETIDRFSDPAQWSAFKRMWTAYNTFFKVSAMFTPGFIVRNGYTAAFNNFVAGVSLGETKDSMKFIRNTRKYGLDEALKKVPAKQRALYETSYQAVIGSGSGQTIDEILQPIVNKKAKRVLESYPLRKWANANQATEEAARMALALSGAKKGLALDENIAQISRYHFNYSDLSTLDEYAKMVVPFWIFATRNIPLQIVNQIARPSMYRSYEKMQNSSPVDENVVLPPWMARRNPMGLPWDPNAVINPDLPQLDMAEQIRMFADPQRLVSQATPLIRLPVELMGNRQLALDIPFKEKPQPVRGPLDLPAYALMSLGLWGDQAGRFPEGGENGGQRWVSQKASYALGNLVPSLATLQRILPEFGGKENYLDRVGSSRWSTLGIPYRRFSAEEQADELTRREFAMKDYLSSLTRTGQLKPRQ